MLLRIITAILLLTIMILITQYPSWYQSFLLLFIIIIACYEFEQLTFKKIINKKFIHFACIISMVIICLYLSNNFHSYYSLILPETVWMIVFVICMTKPNFWQKYPKTFASLSITVNIFIMTLATVAIQKVYLNNQLIIAVLPTAIIDTMAFFFGTYFGSIKIFPHISPKKSLQGALGAYLMLMILALLYNKFDIVEYDYIFWHKIYILAILGDLWISFVKRVAAKKDSGKILPGHGGLLDRIDSHLAALVAWL